jgi:invasion protein IalB
MQRFPKNVACVLVVAGVALMAGAAAAQQLTRSPASAPALQQAHAVPASEEPQRTTATYADWVVVCTSAAGRTPSKVCRMVQGTEVRGKNMPFSHVAVSYPGRGQPIKLTVQVPPNASFATQVRVQSADNDPGITSSFSYCLPVGCFANFELKDDVAKKLGAAQGAGRVTFADAGGHSIAIPLSFNGFAQGLDALAKE